MTLKEMPKVGDKVRYKIADGYDFMTEGKEYEVTEVHKDRFVISDDDSDKMSWNTFEFDSFELVCEPTPVEASPTVIELLANLSRRLYEAEKEITELNEKQAVFFDIDKLMKIRIFDLERQNRVQAYEINELYREVAERG